MAQAVGTTKQFGVSILGDISFPKPSIPVQVGVRSPALIVFELKPDLHSISLLFTTFHSIFGGKLGEAPFSEFSDFVLNLETIIGHFLKKLKSTIQHVGGHHGEAIY